MKYGFHFLGQKCSLTIDLVSIINQNSADLGAILNQHYLIHQKSEITYKTIANTTFACIPTLIFTL